jgi:hypothetical protein
VLYSCSVPNNASFYGEVVINLHLIPEYGIFYGAVFTDSGSVSHRYISIKNGPCANGKGLPLWRGKGKGISKVALIVMDILVNAMVVMRSSDIKPVAVFNLIAANLLPAGDELKINRNNINITMGRNIL